MRSNLDRLLWKGNEATVTKSDGPVLFDFDNAGEDFGAHDAAWNESDHPRGQPDNAGQFAKGSGGGKNAGQNEGEGSQPGGGRASGGGIPDERSGRHDRANQERSAEPDTESDHRGNAPHVLALTKHVHHHEGGNVDLHENVDFHELEKGEESAALFHKAISAAAKANKAGAVVHVYEPEEYKNMRLFLAPDALGGFALKGDDIVSVFKDPKAPYKRFALTALEMGVAQGGRRLDCFDTVLPHFYSKNNFRAVARIPFVDEYAPEGWDYEGMKDFNNGWPDVVFMVYDPEAGPYRPDDGEKVEDYDKAVAIQQKEVARIKKEWPDMVEEPHHPPDHHFIPEMPSATLEAPIEIEGQGELFPVPKDLHDYSAARKKVEKVVYESEEGPVPTLQREAAQSVVDIVADELKYPSSNITISNDVGTFKLNGKTYNYGGAAYLETGRITIYNNTIHKATLDLVVAHEIMHQKFQAVLNARKSEFRAMGQNSARKLVGKEVINEHYPIFHLLKMDNTALAEDDGFTDYSREWWEAEKKGAATSIQAIHETLAEMQMLEWEGSLGHLLKYKESTAFAPLYRAVNHAYEMIREKEKKE